MIPNSRITNEVAAVQVKPTPLNVRVMSFQTGKVMTTTTGGTGGVPIGLLLMLTYASGQAVTALQFRGDYTPNVNIR